MINLQQDADGLIRMIQHYPRSMSISVPFNDGTQEIFSGRRLNEIYDDALAAFRLGNNMDAKGFERIPAKRNLRKNAVSTIAVRPGMSA